MAGRFLLDTNICIYIRQRKPQGVLNRFERLRPGEAVLSVISYGELIYRVSKSDQSAQGMKRLIELTTLVPIMALPEDAAREYGTIRAKLESKGEMIGGNDLWIAAHARAAGLIVVTNNEKEFKRVPGLKVENWVD
jgi:tRNA(fMet)-specific endonuclease VapC